VRAFKLRRAFRHEDTEGEPPSAATRADELDTLGAGVGVPAEQVQRSLIVAR